MKIIEVLAVKSNCYSAGRVITPKGLMLHSIGVNQPSAEVMVGIHSKPGNNVMPHAFLEPGLVYQTLRWNQRGWHGGGTSNDTHIGVEMTEPATIKYTGNGANFVDNNPAATKEFVLGTYVTAAELFAMLCEMFKFDPLKDGVILSHKEGCARGIASNHADVEHLWNKFGLTMNQFRSDVKAKMSAPVDPQTFSVTVDRLTEATAAQLISTLKGMGYSNVTRASLSAVVEVVNGVPYVVTITANSVYVRSGPGTNYAKVNEISDKKAYTIVEESNGIGATKWGKLKSGQGWITLDHVSKV